MKKIFASILALAAFASCSTNIEETTNVNTTLVAPVEISVAESRAFDADLNWSWESTDVIAAYQNEGEKSVNTLALNAAGNFYNEAFTYATEELAQFHFVYPASQLGADYSLTAAQTGVWTPVLYGTVEAATVANLGSVEMNYLSSAFEVRVWAAGRAARKNIVKALLSSEADFVPTWSVNNDLTYTQTLSGKELSLELNSDTAIFNLGEGDFAFTLTLTDAEGATISLPVASKNFAAGKRTILNVEWKSASVNSWYEDYANNKGTKLEGGAIYVNAVGGTPVVIVNGTEMAVVDGKISGLASGTYNVVVSVSGNELVNRSIVVTSIPTLSCNIRTSYSNNGAKDTTNDIAGNELRLSNIALSDSYVASNLIRNNQHRFVYGGTTYTDVFANSVTMRLNWGAYNCYVVAELKNGYICQTPTYTTHVTGVPYHADWRSADYSDWVYKNISDNGSNLKVSDGKLACIISPAFHTPDGALNVKAAIAASTNATSAGNYDRNYIYAGNRSSSASESGAYVTNTYTADFNGLVSDASLNTADATFALTSSNPCMVFTAKDYTVWLLGGTINTYVLQAYICY